MLTPRSLLLAAALCALSATSFAAINDNAATHGQWRNNQGNTISVGADGVKQHADNADECRSMGYKMTDERFIGSDLKSSMQATLAYNRDILSASEGLDAEAVQSVKANVQAIQGLLPKVSASQTYSGIAMQCGDGNSELIFLDNNNAIEQSFGGGETYYEHYRK